ncbi:MAG: hypothetical protein U1F45_02050 [Burkholderiales bacterium]
MLTFNPAPNFEAPVDVLGNNLYDVIVRVDDKLAAPPRRRLRSP